MSLRGDGIDYYAEIRNRDGSVIDRLDKKYPSLFLNFEWSYNRIGGCGQFTLTTKHGFNNIAPYAAGYDVRFYILDYFTRQYVLWYRGLVEQVKTSISGGRENTVITGYGYSIRLQRLVKTETYTNTEISAIVKDILDDTVTPNTPITYDVGDIENTGFTVDSLTFSNTKTSECFESLADVAGQYEWGVGADLKFYFKQRSSTVREVILIGVNIVDFNWLVDGSKIVNQINLEGGITGGSKYTRTISDLASQSRFGIRTQIRQNASITTNVVADQYGGAILAEQSTPAERGAVTLFRNLKDANTNSPFEDTVPLGVVRFRKQSGIKYGGGKYAQIKYGSIIDMQIQQVQYKLDDNGIIASLSLGRYPPELSLLLGRQEFELSQLRQRS